MTERSDKRRVLAAEHALGVLAGADLAEARRLMAADANFRSEVADWAGKLAPLLDEVEPVEAPPGLWAGIDRRTAASILVAANENVVALRRSLARWRAGAGLATALAASLAILFLGQPRAAPPPVPVPAPRAGPSSAPSMVAMLGDERGTKLVANWDPAQKRLIIAAAADMPSDPRHAHEVWVIPAGQAPRSLGTMPEAKAVRMDLAEALASLLRQGAQIAITVEPPGGSPSGKPTGPVIASGMLETT